MPFLRCEACGAKALPIATRCPSCETPFESRSAGASRRELRPCHACDSLLPRQAESCRWCGEEVRRGPSRLAVLASAASVVLLLGGGWFLLERGAGDVITLSAPGGGEVALQEGGAAPGASSSVPSTSRSSTRGSDRVASSTPPASGEAQVPPSDPSETRSAANVTPSPPAQGEPRPASDRPGNDRPASDRQASDRPAIFSLADPAAADGWVRAVARTFVNVRAQPASDSEVQGVVAENDVVFLGDARGAWRQVRTTAGVGWVWEPLFQVGSEGP